MGRDDSLELFWSDTKSMSVLCRNRRKQFSWNILVLLMAYELIAPAGKL
jgi:hypothetical protein